jgi:hypothetical protein
MIGRAGLRNRRLYRSCTRRGRIRFLGSDLHDGSHASSSSSSWLIYLFIGRAQRVTAFNMNSIRPIIIIKEQQITYGFFSQIMSYLLDMLICVGMILLNNLLQYLLFITVIYLSRTCDSIASLICNALLMFMFYPWIKIKLKVLIFPTKYDKRYTCILARHVFINTTLLAWVSSLPLHPTILLIILSIRGCKSSLMS